MQRLTAALFVTISLLLVPPNLWAGKTLAWRHAETKDWQAATQKHLAVGPSGELTLSLETQKLAGLEAGSVFALAMLPERQLIAATAEPSQVVLVTEEETKTLWKSETEQVLSLLPFDAKSVLVGIAPSGKLIRLTLEGEAKDFAKVQGQYVWQMLKDKQGNIFAGTGPEGRIEKISPQGDVQTFYRTNQTHVLSLAMDEQSQLFAGTDGNGLVLALQPDAQSRVLYDAAEQEIRTLHFHQNTLYAGTAAGVVGERGTSRTSPTSSYRGGPNRVYAIGKDGQVSTVFSTNGQIFSLGSFGKDDRSLLIGTGDDGSVYRLDLDSQQAAKTIEVDASQILGILQGNQDQVNLATGNPAALYSLSKSYDRAGSLLSQTLDAKLAARFGAINWWAETPEVTSLSVATRSGNTQTPDETWSNWSAEQSDSKTAKVLSPPGRFLQYRVTFKTNEPYQTPVLRSIVVRYRTANQAPTISSFTVPHVTDGDGKERKEKLSFTWSAKDANEDELAYQLAFRKLGWKQWISLKEVGDEKYEWDITSVPQGVYQLRLSVSDRPSNPASEALSTTRESEPFVIDNQPPSVKAKLLGKPDQFPSIQVHAEDTLCPIVTAKYSVDGGDWQEMFPTDQLFDALKEEFTPLIGPLDPGTHVVVVKATDAAGCTGSTDLVIEIPKSQP